MSSAAAPLEAGRSAPGHVAPDDDPLCPHPAVVTTITPETPGVATFYLQPQDGSRLSADRIRPGQFTMIYVPGVGEVPISVSSISEQGIGHTIRYVGRVTRVLESLGPGAVVGLRGPYGQPWPLERGYGRDILVVAGGLGLAPLRLVLERMVSHRDKFRRLILLYGTRQPADLLYRPAYSDWDRQGLEMMVTVDRADSSWTGNVGVVPVLMNKLKLDPARTLLMSCGPEIMMRFTVNEALNAGIAETDVFISLERNMHCAVGMCGHCQLGPEFLCKDGPVFSYRAVSRFFGRDDF